MIEHQSFEAQLRVLLPSELHYRIPELLQLLEQHAASTNPVADLKTSASLRPLFEQLAGQHIEHEQTQISFGSGNRINTITIGDVAGGNITTLNITFQEHKRTLQRLSWALAGIVVVMVGVGLILYQMYVTTTQRAEQARLVLRQEVLSNVQHMHQRLVFLDVVVADLPDPKAAASLHGLLTSQQIASLRQAWVSKPLTTNPDEALLQLLTDIKADPETVRQFYTSVREVEDDSESLLTTMSSLARSTTSDLEMRLYYMRLLDLDQRRLLNSSRISYVQGLMALNSLDTPADGVQGVLSTLEQFAPQELVPTEQLTQLHASLVDELAVLVDERQALLKQASDDLDQRLVIQPDDSWDKVVGKAIVLRKQGDIELAVEAFRRYGEMFSATDPTAEHYSLVAERFTQQIDTLSTESALYIYDLTPLAEARQAGVEVGDIVVAINDVAITNADTYEAAVQRLSQNSQATVTLLRLEADGQFTRHVLQVSPSVFTTMNLMPI